VADKEINALGITDVGVSLVQAGLKHKEECAVAVMGVGDDEKGLYVCCQMCGWKAYPHNPRDN